MTERELPDETPPDNFEWTAEPEDPDAGGMPAEFVNETGEAVQGVRRDEAESDFDQESNN